MKNMLNYFRRIGLTALALTSIAPPALGQSVLPPDPPHPARQYGAPVLPGDPSSPSSPPKISTSPSWPPVPRSPALPSLPRYGGNTDEPNTSGLSTSPPASKLAAPTDIDPEAQSLTISGTITAVLDGDTLEVDGRVIRLDYIEAPALEDHCGQAPTLWPCGRLARQELVELTSHRTLRCEGRAFGDGYLIAQCFTPDNGDVGRSMTLSGWSYHAHPSFTEYRDEEASARDARRGLWRYSN